MKIPDLAGATRNVGDAVAARSVPIVLMRFPKHLQGVNVDGTFPLEPVDRKVGALRSGPPGPAERDGQESPELPASVEPSRLPVGR